MKQTTSSKGINLIKKEIGNSVFIKEIKFLVKKTERNPTKKTLGPDGFTGEIY